MRLIMFVLCSYLAFKQIKLPCELNVEISLQYSCNMIKKHMNKDLQSCLSDCNHSKMCFRTDFCPVIITLRQSN